MIGKQLDLFGGAPMPPKNIRVEEEEIIPEEPEIISEKLPVNHQVEEVLEDKVEPIPQKPEQQESDVFVQMPVLPNDSINITFNAEETHDWVGEEEQASLNEEPDAESEAPDIMKVLADNGEEATPGLHQEDSEVFPEEETINHHPDSESDQEMDEPIKEESEDVSIEAVGGVEEAELQDEPEEDVLEDEHISLQEGDDGAEIEELPAAQIPDVQEEALVQEGQIVSESTIAEDENQPEVESTAKGLNIPEDNALYSRQYYTMRETASMFNVNQSLLRFWENEFDILKPKKNRKGDRYFRPEDIKNLELIYHLLRVRKFTIEGAKDYLKSKAKSMQTFEMVQRLEKLKHFLLDLKTAI